MKKLLLAVLATASLVGAVTPAAAFNWNDFWYCTGSSFVQDREPYCRSVDWGW